MIKTKKILDGWTKTTLWFKQGIDDMNPLEFCVFSPPDCFDKDYIKLLEENAGQIVNLIQRLTGKKLIIQGQLRKK